MPLRKDSDRAWVAMVGVGFQFLATAGVWAGFGAYLDHRLLTTPWLLILGVMLGVALATWNLIRSVEQLDRATKRKP
ncbi:MAG TPA: AtpZ/AtpI family protein [Planctomycetota bacterium]|jgi:F0F1-type ATP synthase assembly protein I|nr:AtpZ/AtpI family protein [Planctomycetota bacterium]